MQIEKCCCCCCLERLLLLMYELTLQYVALQSTETPWSGNQPLSVYGTMYNLATNIILVKSIGLLKLFDGKQLFYCQFQASYQFKLNKM